MKTTVSASVWTAFFVLFVGTASAADLTLYVKPEGNNQASGRSEEAALGSLQTAVDKVLSQPVGARDGRKIVILPGRYLEQKTIVRDLPDDKPLAIVGMMRSQVRPTFDGNGKGGTWLIMEESSGRPTRLTIKNLEVRNYVTAISFNGKRSAIEKSNSGNVIRNNVFRDIGQIAFREGKPSTAAVRLVNSKDNQIVQNQFINIRNDVGCGALHSVYMAHHSSGNLIEGNVFDGGCGATVKTRDASGANIIRGNKFIDQSEPVFLDSFCDKDTRDDCTKQTSECPSWDNAFESNSMARLGVKARKTPVKAAGDDSPDGCPQAPSRGNRVTERANREER